MSVICIGEALIDMICTDKGSSLSDGQNFLKKPGGAPTNVAAAIGALGGEVSLSGERSFWTPNDLRDARFQREHKACSHGLENIYHFCLRFFNVRWRT